jgi:hypothetical protein
MRSVSLFLAAPFGAWAAAVSSRDADTTGAESVRSTSKGAKAFSLGEVENLDYKGGDAPAEFLKAHTKYVDTLPPWLAEAVESNPDLNSKFKQYLQQGTSPADSSSVFPNLTKNQMEAVK